MAGLPVTGPLGYVGRCLTLTLGYCQTSGVLLHAGAIAFFTLFSIAPVALLAVAVAGLVFGEAAAQGQLVLQISQWVGPEVAEFIQSLVLQSRPEESGLLPGLVGVLAILFGATTVFAQLQHSLHAVWDLAPKPSKSAVWLVIRHRLISLLVVLLFGGLLVLALLAGAAAPLLVNVAERWVRVPGFLLWTLETGVSIVMLVVVSGILITVLSDVKLAWHDVLPGALLAAMLFAAGRLLLGSYLSLWGIRSAYGAAGALFALLVWVYFSALTLLVSAALTRAVMELRGRRLRPSFAVVRVRREYLD